MLVDCDLGGRAGNAQRLTQRPAVFGEEIAGKVFEGENRINMQSKTKESIIL